MDAARVVLEEGSREVEERGIGAGDSEEGADSESFRLPSIGCSESYFIHIELVNGFIRVREREKEALLDEDGNGPFPVKVTALFPRTG